MAKGKSKEQIARYVIEEAIGKFISNDEDGFRIYQALKKLYATLDPKGYDYADMTELELEEGETVELILTQDYEGQSIQGMVELIESEILALKKFLAEVLEGDFVGYIDSIREEITT